MQINNQTIIMLILNIIKYYANDVKIVIPHFCIIIKLHSNVCKMTIIIWN